MHFRLRKYNHHEYLGILFSSLNGIIVEGINESKLPQGMELVRERGRHARFIRGEVGLSWEENPNMDSTKDHFFAPL